MKKQLKDDQSKFGVKPASVKMNPLLKRLIKSEHQETNINTPYPYFDRVLKDKDMIFLEARISGKTLQLAKILFDLERRHLFGI